MEIFEKSLEIINKFFLVPNNENFGDNIFQILKEIFSFKSGYIFFDDSVIYSYNPSHETLMPVEKEDLKVKNTIFGKIVLEGCEFSTEERLVFKTCAAVISNIIKDIEMSKIMKMQIEALKEGYTDIKETNSKLVESEQVKTKFLSHMSHELRTPLNSILGYADLLNNEFAGKLNEKQKGFVNDIKISGLHLLEMVNEILDISKIESGSMALNLGEFSLKDVIFEVLNVLNPLFGDIRVDVQVDDALIFADYNKFKQILLNLLSNAIKYTNNEIRLRACCLDSVIKISVKDNGVGIDKKNHEKIFEKFEQLDNGKQNSTGLGLTITKELVKLHNGRIFVNSELSKGAEFIVELPEGEKDYGIN